jgi:PAS domain S-box-containing protein
MVQVFITHDRYGGVKRVCSLFETVFGWSPHEVEGLRMPYFHPEESSAALKTIVGDLSGGQRPFRTRGVTKSGASVDMIVTGARWDYCEGSTGEFVVGVRPIPAERDCRNARILSSIRKKLEMRDRELEASKSDLDGFQVPQTCRRHRYDS